MVNLFYALLVLAWSPSWAQKSIQLDNAKALKTQIECQRIAELKLVKSQTPLKINCQLDNMNFYTEVDKPQAPGPVRIGSFNILHPGTDKTLFKDLSLVAGLINKEFDVMAAVEIVEVLATPRENNAKLLPYIEIKSRELKTMNEKIQSTRTQLQAQEQLNNSSELQTQLGMKEERVIQLDRKVTLKNEELEIAREEVSKHSEPGFTLWGIEIGKKRRLQKLQLAQENEKNIISEIMTFKKEQIIVLAQVNDIRNQIVKLSNSENALIIKILKQDLSDFELEGKKLEKTLAETTRYYRIPGYLKILEELRKLDGSWSLIMTPHGDAAVETNTQEHAGFYYRASKVSLGRNIHCSKKHNRDSSGCYPNLYADYMGEDKASLFSRRPFMATFNDGAKNFSMLATHIIFESPADLNTQRDILKRTFNVESLSELPTGINKQIYARFAEAFITLQLIEKLRFEGLERIIYAGDFNLEAQNPFWNYIFEKLPGFVLLIKGKTSLSENRFVKGQESGGVSSNYDHFIMAENDVTNCRQAEVINFMANDFSERIKEKYLIRQESEKGPYLKDLSKEALVSERMDEMKLILKEYNFLLGKDGAVLPDIKNTSEDLKNFRDRVFESQLNDETFYKVFAQIISDHLPIKIECLF